MGHRSHATIVDVAQIAGVSPTTVSYVLSGPKERAARISKETTAKILAVVDEIGYVPNHSARTLRLRRTNRVLFLGSRITSLYSQIIARSIEEGLTKHDLSLSVHIGSGSEHIRRAITVLHQNQADGLIVETEDDFVPDLREAATNGDAIVAIGPREAEATFDVVSIDDAPTIEQAMRHVVERGCRHFVLMSIRAAAPWEHRIHVAHSHLTSLGVSEKDISVVHCPHDRNAAYQATIGFLNRMPRPVAIYSGADLSAVGVMWACQRMGLDIPKDVAVIGHGNTPESHISVPQLTSLGPINTDFTEAADMIASRLRDRSMPGRHITKTCQLSIRESS